MYRGTTFFQKINKRIYTTIRDTRVLKCLQLKWNTVTFVTESISSKVGIQAHINIQYMYNMYNSKIIIIINKNLYVHF